METCNKVEFSQSFDMFIIIITKVRKFHNLLVWDSVPDFSNHGGTQRSDCTILKVNSDHTKFVERN